MPIEESKVEAIYFAALEKPSPEDCVAYLDEKCANDPSLRQRVEALLNARPKIGNFLQGHAADMVAATSASSASERPGAQIGPYKLLQQIGEGGMGTVYMAEQTEPIHRKVALKLIKAGMDSHQIIARFEAERQALAMMDHVNIARVLDAGTTESGRPYFVMELVHGVPITRYCDDNRLTPRQRLELFVPVCQAIQHAHQKGIIHRDIKPSNVMVTLYDGNPVPKVIDFGVAKATEQKLTERTLFTQYGTMVGTLEYMSPEQAEMSALGVDTRSDIYALGVVLYELLTGSTPLNSKRMNEAAYGEILRLIKEEEPPKPSTRLSESGEALASISAQRHTEPAKLSKLMRGELDWMVMKTLEKDRNRRYESASGFAADIQHYLDDEPVLACPPSALYRLWKFARRNRAALTVGVLLALSLLVMVAGITAGVGWAARDRAARDEEEVRQIAARQAKADGQLEIVLAEVVQLEQAEKWSEALVSARRAQPLLAGDEVAIDLRERVRKTLAELEFVQRLDDIRAEGGSVWGDPSLVNMAVADRNYAKAFGEFGIDLDALPRDEAVDQIKSRRSILPAVITAIDDWVTVRNLSKGESDERRLVDVINVVDPDPWRQQLRNALASKDWPAVHRLAKSAELDRQSAATLYVLGATLYGTGESLLQFDVLRRAQWKYPDDFWINHRLGVSLIWKKSPDRVAEGIGYLRAAVALRPESGHAIMNLGNGHHFVGRYEEAEVCYRRAIELNPKSANSQGNLGNALSEQGKLDEAIAAYRKAIELDPKLTWAHTNLGNALKGQGKLDEAIACHRTAIELDPKFAGSHTNLGNALKDQGKLDEAIAAYRKAIELDPKRAAAHGNLGNTLSVQGKLDEAIAAHKKAVEFDPKVANHHYNLGNALQAQKKLDEAIAAYRKAIELDPKFAATHSNLGIALSKQGKLDEAIAIYKKAIELDPKRANTFSGLGTALLGQEKVEEAIANYRKAIELDPKFAGAHSNLGNALYKQGELDQAIACCRIAIELDPKSANAYGNLGNALWAKGKRDEAIASFRQTIALDPKLDAAHVYLGIALYEQGKRDEAIACFRQAIKLAPQFAIAHYRLGTALAGQGKRDEAITCFRQAIELDPQFAIAHNELAWHLATGPDPGLRDPQRAVALAAKAVELDPKNPSYPSTLGAAQYRTGQWKAAIAALEQSMVLRAGGDSVEWFFLAMAHWHLGEKEAASKLYQQAVEWMEKNKPQDEELQRFREEAAELLKINDKPAKPESK